MSVATLRKLRSCRSFQAGSSRVVATKAMDLPRTIWRCAGEWSIGDPFGQERRAAGDGFSDHCHVRMSTDHQKYSTETPLAIFGTTPLAYWVFTVLARVLQFGIIYLGCNTSCISPNPTPRLRSPSQRSDLCHSAGTGCDETHPPIRRFVLRRDPKIDARQSAHPALHDRLGLRTQ